MRSSEKESFVLIPGILETGVAIPVRIMIAVLIIAAVRVTVGVIV